MGSMIFIACHGGQENDGTLGVKVAPIEVFGLPKEVTSVLSALNRRLSTRLSIDRSKSFNPCVEGLTMALRPKLSRVSPTVGAEGNGTHFRFTGHLSLSDLHANGAEILVEGRVSTAYDPGHKGAVETAFDEFLLLLNAQLSLLYQPPPTLVNEAGNLSDEQLVILLERLSFCQEKPLTAILKQSLSRERPRHIRFRSLGVITELKLSMANDWLIDTVDLNDMEWTLAAIQTMSHLAHPTRKTFEVMIASRPETSKSVTNGIEA